MGEAESAGEVWILSCHIFTSNFSKNPNIKNIPKIDPQNIYQNGHINATSVSRPRWPLAWRLQLRRGFFFLTGVGNLGRKMFFLIFVSAGVANPGRTSRILLGMSWTGLPTPAKIVFLTPGQARVKYPDLPRSGFLTLAWPGLPTLAKTKTQI